MCRSCGSAYYFCAWKLRYCSRSSGFALRATFVTKGCDFQAGAAWTRDKRAIVKAYARTTRQLPNTVSQTKKTENSNGATARALRRTRSPQRVRRAQDIPVAEQGIGDVPLPNASVPPYVVLVNRYECRAQCNSCHSHGAAAKALRHARSPQRVQLQLRNACK